MKKKAVTIVFMGCSITDADHKGGDLGSGYVAITAAMLRARFPDVHFRFINSGIGGECAFQCRERWQRDVLDHDPHFVTFMIGGNDAYLYSLGDHRTELTVSGFRKIVEELIGKTLAHKGCKGMVLVPQHYLTKDATEEGNPFPTRGMVKTLPPIVKAFRAAAAKYGVPVIDCDKALWAQTKQVAATDLAADYVHPNTYGHTVMALQLADALEKQIREFLA
ncbi:MAG: SGNH/GDSL hydrolase family protein [Clostridia bacterium]|nr:SGNH/GDSL hydrolase family protein [Clostridia bacterium]